MINTPEYKLAKFLDNIIKPHIPHEYMLKLTGDCINKLRSYQFSSGQKFVSFDVFSLFTNVPYEETIKLIANQLFSEKKTNQPLIKKEIFIKLFKLATQGQFLYMDVLYNESITIGLQLGPTIANFFLPNWENRILKNKSQHFPKLYLRYIDDVFAVFENNNACLSFLNLLNI